jgi:division protein CdvB (Snf7/Vps24/ESCRT-III family)
MGNLQAARERLDAALARLDVAAARLAELPRAPAAAGDEAAAAEAARDREILRAECERLRGELDAANDRNLALGAAAEEAGGRLDGAIARLDAALAGGG